MVPSPFSTNSLKEMVVASPSIYTKSNGVITFFTNSLKAMVVTN
jgi:hypothetical protein